MAAKQRCECSCGCERRGTERCEESGLRLCDRCLVYARLETGEIVCGEQTSMFNRCHECGERIRWGSIASHVIEGACGCGDGAWRNEEAGESWPIYRYAQRTRVEEE